MRNLLFTLLLVIVSGIVWAQDVEIVKHRLGTYEIYETQKALIGSLLKVDPNIPVDKLAEIYQRGLLTYDSVVTNKEYNYKHFWLTKNTDVSYKVAVYVEADKEIKTIIQPGSSKQELAVDVYFLLVCFLMTAISLSIVSIRDWTMKDHISFYILFFLSIAFCFGSLSATYWRGDSSLRLINSLLFVALLIYAIGKDPVKFFSTRESYLNAQWINLILIILTSSIITTSFLFPILLIVAFWVPFGIIIKTAKIKIIKTT